MVMMPHWPIYIGPEKEINSSLERIRYVLNSLNNPQNKIKNIIHVTGTKGKGSTTLFISNILKESGYNVNTYTSPHIYHCNERIMFNLQNITDSELFKIIEEIRVIYNDLNLIDMPSLMEIFTLSAILLFSRNNADFNIIEVGMGGLFDVTNVFDNNPPLICIFTPIFLDHKLWLGDTIESIAFHKSHIIKEKVKNVIISSQSKEALKIIHLMCQKCKIDKKQIYQYELDYETYKVDQDESLMIFEDKLNHEEFVLEKPNSIGEHQFINSSVAIMTALKIREMDFSKITLNTIQEGVKKMFNIARMQKIKNIELMKFFHKDSLFYVDGAHNRLASFALMKFVADFKLKNNDYLIFIIVSMSKGADYKNFLLPFGNKEIVNTVICTRANLESLPASPDVLSDICDELNIKNEKAYTIESSLSQIIKLSNGKKCLIIATGSLYIARDIEQVRLNYIDL